MDRRVIWAVALMMLVALLPMFFRKQQPVVAGQRSTVDSQQSTVNRQPSAADSQRSTVNGQPVTVDRRPSTVDSVPADTVVVSSSLYTYRFSTRGAAMVGAELARYGSMAQGDSGRAQLIRPGEQLYALAIASGNDTMSLANWNFTPSARQVTVGDGPATLSFTGSNGTASARITYTFRAGYGFDVEAQVGGVGANGGLAMIGLGTGLQNTEKDSTQNFAKYAVVVKNSGADRTDFRSFDPGESKVLPGPFEWAAVKSKYFVASLFAFDSNSTTGRLSGVTAAAPATGPSHPNAVRVGATMPVTAAGTIRFSGYVGPMEYDQLRAIGHDFDDVNPYGWPGVRTVIRFFAVPVRWLLVQMHSQLNLTYGVVLILFGILVRVLLWPLNQKAMRANMRMQELQPELKAAQERYKDNPQLLQQEMFRLYKEYGVNPMSGCWPMMLPMPILFALFFVFENAIELRGQAFLWLPDVAQHDPIYVIPVLMGLSMWAVSKVGQMGMPPNPQMKMMLYVMPIMMTFFFFRFAAGLNLYYLVSNLASIPQQWMLGQERKRRTARAIVNVTTEGKAGRREGGKGRR
ncbi:MAG TPA: membrane protein insertase YidC [Gemmatimonadales bacterium]|nr:membrane protein insertase YidC [Gemmatimonadales bacterium]